MGYPVFHEVSREIIRRELETGGHATPWQDVEIFSQRVLQGRKEQFVAGLGKSSFYDRGIPDIAGFMRKDKLIVPETLWNDCLAHRYHTTVFITPPWEAIFHRDEERKEDFMTAIKVHKALESIYTDLGYLLIPVPMGSIAWRARYVLDKVG